MTDVWREAGIDLVHLNDDRPMSLIGVVRLIDQIRRWRPDVVMSYGLRAGLMTRAAAAWTAVPVVLASQQGVEDWKTWKHIVMERLTSPLVDLYIGVSQACTRRLATCERIPPRQLMTIPNGIAFSPPPDLEARVAQLQHQYPFPPGATVVGTVGRIQTMKGHDDMMAAAAIALRRRGDLYFVLVGDDHRNGQVQQLARQLGVAQRCLFVGYSDQVAVWLKRFDIFLLPSLSEGLPVAVLEAMFMALPVIATAVGGTPEVVLDGITGLLVPAAQPQTMAEKIVELAGNAQLRHQLGQAGMQRAQEHFGLQRMIRRYEQTITGVYARKLSTGRVPARDLPVLGTDRPTRQVTPSRSGRPSVVHVMAIGLSAKMFMGGLFRRLLAEGYDVSLVCSDDQAARAVVSETGVRFEPVKIPQGISPLSDALAIWNFAAAAPPAAAGGARAYEQGRYHRHVGGGCGGSARPHLSQSWAVHPEHPRAKAGHPADDGAGDPPPGHARAVL